LAIQAHAGPIYEVAEHFREQCLRRGRSLLWPGREVWTVENSTALWEAFIGNPDESTLSFFEKWQKQLAGASEDVHRLAAEAIAIYYLHPSNIGQATKLNGVREVLNWKLKDDQPDLQVLERAYATNIGSAGQYYLQARPWQVAFYLEFGRRVRVQGADPGDAESCRRIADEARAAVEHYGNCDPARHIILHLLFPNEYERIASTGHKKLIVKAFKQHAGGATDLDEALRNIRQALVQQYQRPDLDFYHGDIANLWQVGGPPPPAGPRYSKEGLQRLIEYFKQELESFGSRKYWDEERQYKLDACQRAQPLLAEERLRALIEQGAFEEAKADIKRVTQVRYLLVHYDTRPIREAPAESLVRSLYNLLYGSGELASRFDAWVEVLAQVDKRCWPAATYFLMLSEPESHLMIKPTPVHVLLRELKSDIAWEAHPSASLYFRLQGLAYSLLAELATLGARDMIDIYSFMWRVQYVSGAPPPTDGPTQTPPEETSTFDDLVEATNMTPEELRELEAILSTKQQIILEGPPGSGKTWVAQKLARYFTGNALDGAHDESLETVQFHQSYGYEDFMQGIRPQTNPETHQLEYHVRDGIFKRFCEVAARNPDKPFVLIIDEINRGNISRIFGELLFLLEYREQSVRLPYALPNEPGFRIPGNIHLIGTMNTTDRSLAQIDYALRRRFYFYRLAPVADQAAPVLERWLEKQGLPAEGREKVVKTFVRLNERVRQELGEEFQVGHSYFMRGDVVTDAGMRRVWNRAVMPLLEEYFHSWRNRPDLLAQLTVEKLSLESPATAAGEP
jgi:5-methylcytosine-specific restriction protein B